jgi:hypothetical protein
MDYGPGCDPRLFQDARTYCNQPVLVAQFIPSESVRPPISLHLLLFETKGRAYGQVISELEQHRFPENPVSEPDFAASIFDIEYESRDHYDPLVALAGTISGLQRTAERLGGYTPILNAVEVLNKNYAEAGKDLVNYFGTPLSNLKGELADTDVLSDVIASESGQKPI